MTNFYLLIFNKRPGGDNIPRGGQLRGDTVDVALRGPREEDREPRGGERGPQREDHPRAAPGGRGAQGDAQARHCECCFAFLSLTT